MRTVICYRSYFGATRQYARWLGDALECRVVTFADVTDGLLDDADRVVVLSGSYGGFVPIERFIAVRWGILQHKPLYIVSVGRPPDPARMAVPAGDGRIKYFHLPGAVLGIKPMKHVTKDQIYPLLRYLRNR